ncbi:hypothetical protein GCM10011529_27910 [Polymorphobacter glacialis]|uniref:Lipoprotein n=1 Tax=Sandarakinorhabdus glacialis TaxID=1614636 RepID=A0A917A0A1_9SPHN|nr:hypothetical protein [Polymorphobacter glacialis]GGE19747.1 hypothetical protein GCM10011529_27910 [Polymorphobacter glacialis]
MRYLPVLVVAALSGVLLFSACSKDEKTETAKAETGQSGALVDIQGDSGTGAIAVKMPGGIEANIKIPENIVGDTEVDIDGVGLYPGAAVRGVNAHIGEGPGRATVTISFASAADAAVVADWYQQQFAEKKVTAKRSGETLSGKTEDGDDFTLAMAPADAGSLGKLTIVNH